MATLKTSVQKLNRAVHKLEGSYDDFENMAAQLLAGQQRDMFGVPMQPAAAGNENVKAEKSEKQKKIVKRLDKTIEKIEALLKETV